MGLGCGTPTAKVKSAETKLLADAPHNLTPIDHLILKIWRKSMHGFRIQNPTKFMSVTAAETDNYNSSLYGVRLKRVAIATICR